MSRKSDRAAQRALELHERLRAFLLATMAQEAPDAIAGALMYKVASLIACVTETEAEAHALLRRMVEIARRQIANFGVGRPHP